MEFKSGLGYIEICNTHGHMDMCHKPRHTYDLPCNSSSAIYVGFLLACELLLNTTSVIQKQHFWTRHNLQNTMSVRGYYSTDKCTSKTNRLCVSPINNRRSEWTDDFMMKCLIEQMFARCMYVCMCVFICVSQNLAAFISL